jgi:hypothetical protein
VSWQVTGVRHDAAANAHRIVNELEKEASNKGKYLNAADLGKPANTQMGYEVGTITDDKNMDAVKAHPQKK